LETAQQWVRGWGLEWALVTETMMAQVSVRKRAHRTAQVWA
jgi:hypothetical protein